MQVFTNVRCHKPIVGEILKLGQPTVPGAYIVEVSVEAAGTMKTDLTDSGN